MNSTAEVSKTKLEMYDLNHQVRRLEEHRLRALEEAVVYLRETIGHVRSPSKQKHVAEELYEAEKALRKFSKKEHDAEAEPEPQKESLPGRGGNSREELEFYLTWPRGTTQEQKTKALDQILDAWGDTGKNKRAKHTNAKYDVPLWIDENKGLVLGLMKIAKIKGVSTKKKYKRRQIDSSDMYPEEFIKFMDKKTKGGRKNWGFRPPAKLEHLLLKWKAEQEPVEEKQVEAEPETWEGNVYVKTSHNAVLDVYATSQADIDYEEEQEWTDIPTNPHLTRHRPVGIGGRKKQLHAHSNPFGALSEQGDIASDFDISQGQISTDTESGYSVRSGHSGASARRHPLERSVSAPKAPPKRKKLRGNRDNNVGRGKHKILPNITSPNFSLKKIAEGHYVLKAIDVTHGVIAQVKSLLQRVPGKRFYVNGKIFGRLQGYKEVIRLLIRDSTVEVRL